MAHDHPLDSNELDRLLQRILAGEATPAEQQSVDAALGEYGVAPGWRDAVTLVLKAPELSLEYDAHRFAVDVRSKMSMARPMQRPAVARSTPNSFMRRFRVPILFAAAAAVVMGIGFAGRSSGDATLASSRTYETRSGMFATIALPDGGHIFLAPRSRLTLTNGRHERRASLIGEARFEITANARAPFVVQTGAVLTRVLGTTFEVRRYADDTTGRVVVYSGRVLTRGQGAAITLDAGMAARFTDSLVASTGIAPEVSTDWANHQLVFHEVPIPALLRTLERWYGYEFKLADSSMAMRHVTAVFPIGESAQMLKYVRHVLNVRLQFDGTVITLSPSRDALLPKSARHAIEEFVAPSTLATEVGR